MENKQVKELIENFKAYRDLLVPVQKNLNDFVDTYDVMRDNIDKLNVAFEGDVKGKLDLLFKQMSDQTSKTASLYDRLDQLATATDKFSGEFSKLMQVFSKVETLANTVNTLEQRAENQIAKLETAIAEKTKHYNIKDLEKALEHYNQDVKKVGDFINKDIAESLLGNQKQLENMREGLDGIVKKQQDDTASLVKLLESHKVSNDFLKKIIEEQDVNEAYLFEILDKWAASRRVKVKN